MPDNSIDAIKVAKAIQKNELSILDGKEFKVRDKINKKKRRGKHVKKDKPKYTLDEIGDALFLLIDRFDYVVKANNLKDLPKQKRAKK